MSNTFLVGEKYIYPTDFTGRGTDGTVFSSSNGEELTFRRFCGVSGSHTRRLVPDRADPGPDAGGVWADKAFGSWHPGVSQFVFCDGSVKPIPNSIALATLELLAKRSDGQVIPEY